MWFVFALLTMLMWGTADLFYKKGNNDTEHYSHLKTSIMVGLIMGLHAVLTLFFSGIDYDFRNLYIYLPVSAMYILSMTVGYFGLKYLELSISSPHPKQFRDCGDLTLSLCAWSENRRSAYLACHGFDRRWCSCSRMFRKARRKCSYERRGKEKSDP